MCIACYPLDFFIAEFFCKVKRVFLQDKTGFYTEKSRKNLYFAKQPFSLSHKKRNGRIFVRELFFCHNFICKAIMENDEMKKARWIHVEKLHIPVFSSDTYSSIDTNYNVHKYS